MKFIKDTVISLSTQMITLVLAMAVASMVARVLGPSGKGAYSLITLIPSLLTSLGSLGIGVASVYFVGKKSYKLEDIASNSLVSALGLGMFIVIASLAYSFVFHPSFLREVVLPLTLIAVLMVPFILLTTYFSSILLGENRIIQYNLVFLSGGVILLVFMSVALFAAKGGITGATLAWAGCALGVAIVSIALVHRSTPIKWSFNFALFKDSVKFGSQAYFGNVIQLLNLRLNMFLVAFFMGVTFVGYYSVAFSLAEALWYVSTAAGVVIFPRTASSTTKEANMLTPRVCRNTLFITILTALVLFSLSRYIIILLFGSSFLPALKPLWILLPGVTAFSICKVLTNEMAGRGKPIINTAIAAASLLVNIPLNLLLIPKWGVTGAAVASTVAYAVSAAMTLIIFITLTKNSLFSTIIIKPEDFRIYTGVLSNVKRRVWGQVLDFIK